MIEYANDSVIRMLKQYEMLSKSLTLTGDLEQKQDVCYQMTRIIKNVLDITNNIYEEKYSKVVNRKTYLMDEEKNRLLELVNLINERRAYVNNQVTSNADVTGITLDYVSVLGEDKLDEYKEEVKIIDKYKNNIRLNSTLKDEVSNLNVSIKKASDKVNSNKMLNKQLEIRMKKILDTAFKKFSLYELKERKKEIDLAYTELGYSLEKAKENAKIARKDCSSEIIIECDNMLASITLEYERYKEKKLILRLMEVYDEDVDSYEELLTKREEINNILTGIVSSELYLEVGDELNKEYATIKLEQQDKATLKSLEEEKENKLRTLEEIKQENSSDQFKGILANLLENEKKYQEQLLLEKKKQEEERKKKELEEEKKKHQEILRRQKALEEERKKEIEERTKQLLVEKKNPVLSSTKDDKEPQTKSEYNRTLKNVDKVIDKIEEDAYHSKEYSKEKEAFMDRTLENSEKIERTRSRISKTPDVSKVNVRPSDDIFSRKWKSRTKDDGIPVIQNNRFDNNFVSNVKETEKKDVFPKVTLEKKDDIFPKFPSLNNEDSFFDDSEFKDLNKFVEDDKAKKNSWF